MDVFSTTAEFLDVNCYAVRAEGEDDCVFIDSGFDCAPGLAEIVEEENLVPRAVLLTHGHPDHVLGLTDVLSRWNVPVHLGDPDRYRLDKPAETLSPQFAQMLEPLVRGWSAPEVNALVDAQTLEVAGLTITALAAPGHTEGSTLLRVHADGEEIIFTGDVVFAGAIGRVDLPGGDASAMAQSLRAFTTLPDVPIYPGHGPRSRVGHESATNPFL
ncbi:MBL fold metallo-hydrolase [Brevibacterium marinum]|uniref:Glyoxylase-like metal-dependent hydrolase (Beta-lactamase superfamily II) n=1 Tax=Brevibacterium marinum TaxID=418643 RepID=A0A846S043_9MICO|nr:MBL fold metallo-hydrolase [Brevibacterium marinum]NJC57576.1 glyoxylase-like metal-dependent hydrolase (beta-lactamase superfamily II) [Brevibacterium marinum]